MNARTWQTCTEPEPMLEWLRKQVRFSARKAQLFAVACCRPLWPVLAPDSRLAIETGERHADGLAGTDEVETVLLLSRHAIPSRSPRRGSKHWHASLVARAAAGAAWYALLGEARLAAQHADYVAKRRGLWPGTRPGHWQCDLLRELFAPSYTPKSEQSLDGNAATALNIAQVIYDEKRWFDMPYLADALTDAGWLDDELISHCREQVEHARGCWVLDLLLRRS